MDSPCFYTVRLMPLLCTTDEWKKILWSGATSPHLQEGLTRAKTVSSGVLFISLKIKLSAVLFFLEFLELCYN
jgi:hypothetical protein